MQQFLINTWSVVLTALVGYFVYLLKEQRKERAKENAKRDTNSNGTKLILFYMLQRLHTEYKYQGYVTYDQRSNFKDMYDAYHGLGGNGYGTKMWNEVQELECKSGDMGVSLYARMIFDKQKKENEGE